MTKKLGISFCLLASCLAGCATASVSSSGEASLSSSGEASYALDDIETTVYGDAALSERNNRDPSLKTGYTYSFAGSDIEVVEGKIEGLKAGTSTTLTVTNPSGQTASCLVKVLNRDYASWTKQSATEASEGWFKDVTVSPISALTESFANGMDISSAAFLYEKGARFYNADGVEQSLFQILKNAGVNWVRLRLWNDPTNHSRPSGDNYVSYGGGRCDYEHVAWMAREAVSSGLHYLLDFHYSDFWADPGNQVIPKAWANLTTVSEMKSAIYAYTKETLEKLKALGAAPSAVQLGNETTGGFLYQLPGTDSASTTGNSNAGYLTNKTTLSTAMAGRTGTTAFHDYMASAIAAVKAVDPTIQIMIHLAKGLTATAAIESYFAQFNDLEYDLVGLSAYVYYAWSNKSTLHSSLATLSSYFSGKRICLVETSYGFSYAKSDYASFSFQNGATCGPVASYPVSIQGQANLIHDITEEVASLSNGFGVFYWEGAWVVRNGAGWADSGSTNSWANQGLFSYEGKALGSLEVYQKIRGK
jgi:arabinogalactan endo-1,4-beta-galactosidase